MNKKGLSGSNTKAKFIVPAILKVGRDKQTQLGREIFFTDRRIYVKEKLNINGKRKFTHSNLFYKPNVFMAAIEAEGNKRSVKRGIQLALGYGNTLDIPFVESSGHSFINEFYLTEKCAY